MIYFSHGKPKYELLVIISKQVYLTIITGHRHHCYSVQYIYFELLTYCYYLGYLEADINRSEVVERY